MSKYPLYSLIALFLFVGAAVLLLIFGDASNGETITIISVMLANIPGLVAAFMAERSNNAIQNGTVVEKARQGAKIALSETGVTDAIAQSPQQTATFMDTMIAQTAALKNLLEKVNGPTV